VGDGVLVVVWVGEGVLSTGGATPGGNRGAASSVGVTVAASLAFDQLLATPHNSNPIITTPTMATISQRRRRSAAAIDPSAGGGTAPG
jgi:hypothetical protein